MTQTEIHKIRPAGRHLLTIGRDLIQDPHAAIVELIKNAYDADSPKVTIELKATKNRDHYTITVEDTGHGMSKDSVIKDWLVPSTDNKLKNPRSPNGRIRQGRKGVGRFAASILGTDLLLETITANGEKTTVFIEWKDFEAAEYLDLVEIHVQSEKTTNAAGTRLIISGSKDNLSEWKEETVDLLRSEIKKLIPPLPKEFKQAGNRDEFGIELIIDHFLEGKETRASEQIEPYPIVELYDYKISGKVDASGNAKLNYTVQRAQNTVDEEISFKIPGGTGCGNLFFDIRAYDREKEAIEALIHRGLKDERNNYLGKLEARQLLNSYNGIGVYRNGFRIRPLGDADFDWLKLNEQRIQNPSLRIGSNQVIGYVQVESEENSGLIEKSARDGLKENKSFANLRRITHIVIADLEQRRFSFRSKTGLSRKTLKIEKDLERILSFEPLKESVRTKLIKHGMQESVANEVLAIISSEEQIKNQIVDEIRETVAIYQGQATLGKIINVILHEGRRPLNFFKNQIPNIRFWHDALVKSFETANMKNFMTIAESFGENADIFVKLFSRLDPLASGTRSNRKVTRLKKIIENTSAVFAQDLQRNKIKLNISGSDDISFFCWQQDIYTILTNLMDNSLYWLVEKKGSVSEISIKISGTKDKFEYLDYRDTGPGIPKSMIESEVIFEPHFSTKPHGKGMGLGLAIAGEAATRNDLELRAIESNSGAYFRLQPKEA